MYPIGGLAGCYREDIATKKWRCVSNPDLLNIPLAYLGIVLLLKYHSEQCRHRFTCTCASVKDLYFLLWLVAH